MDIIEKKIDMNESINTQIDNELSTILGKEIKTKKKSIVVLSGGGIKGIAHIGAMRALEKLNMLKDIMTFAGTSAGAIVATLLVIGYSPTELYDFITIFDFKKMRSFNSDGILSTYGLDTGKNVMYALEKMFTNKEIDPKITFAQLYKKTGKTLIVTTACINDKNEYYLSHKTEPDMSVILAVRMSISIPIYFTPVMYNGKMFIDGGCIDNYPIQLFKDELDSVIGVYLTSIRHYIKNVSNVEDFLMNLVQCLFEGVTCNSLKGFEKQSIKISVNEKGIMDLDMNSDKKKEIFMAGYNATIEKFTDN